MPFVNLKIASNETVFPLQYFDISDKTKEEIKKDAVEEILSEETTSLPIEQGDRKIEEEDDLEINSTKEDAQNLENDIALRKEEWLSKIFTAHGFYVQALKFSISEIEKIKDRAKEICTDLEMDFSSLDKDKANTNVESSVASNRMERK